MRAFIDNALRQLREFFGKMSKKERIRAGILAAVVVVLAIVTVSILNRVTYETLYYAQDVNEAGEIYAAVEAMGETVMIENTRILVPEGSADRIRAALANQGFGSLEPDPGILADASGFGTTEDHRRRLLDQDNSARIRQQILQSPRIQSAVVFAHSGQTSQFARPRGNRDATASVVLTLSDNSQLLDSEVQSIAAIIRGLVPGIEDENISISDSNLNLYRVGGDDSGDIISAVNSQIALQNFLKQQIQTQGLQLLAPIFGDRVMITPNVILDFDTRVEEHIEFAPPIPGEMDGIVRSASRLFETQLASGAAVGVPGTDNNLNPPQYPYGPLTEGEEYRRVLNETNYEINQTIIRIDRERGQIKELSIAILLDSEGVAEDYSSEVADLVSMAFGIAPDNITVQRLPFDENYGRADAEFQAQLMEHQQRLERQELYRTIIMWAVILLLGLAFMLLVSTIVRGGRSKQLEAAAALAGGGIDYLADGEIEEIPPEEEVELTTKSTSLEQIERFIEKDPGAVAQLLRNWLTDE